MATGILHVYHSDRGLNLFEHLPSYQGSDHPPPKHVLLFIGGLFDNFNSPRYVNDIAALFPAHNKQKWRVMHVQLSTNGKSWGILDIDRDVEEIGICVQFIRDTLLKDENADVVLMGHSTGCQDTMRYLTGPNPLSQNKPPRPKVQGAILQAPVSDREAALHVVEEDADVKKAFIRAMEIATSTPTGFAKDVVLPLSCTKPIFGLVPISVERWLSLTSPGSPQDPSNEDFFSSDLSNDTFRKTFGSIGLNGLLRRKNGSENGNLESILILISDADEFAQPRGGQSKLLERWRATMREDTCAFVHRESAVIMNATHDISGDDWSSKEARLVVLRKKVLAYLQFVVGDVDDQAREIWQHDYEEVMKMKKDDGKSVEDRVSVLKL